MADGRQHGPLPMFLIVLTVVTGLVDAVSYLRLGRVFVTNQTGNVVFLGFALAGAGGITATASLVALVAFAGGGALGGRLGAPWESHRGHLLAVATAIQACLVGVSAVVATVAGLGDSRIRLVVIGVLGIAMGGQNGIVRRLGVPDLPTTVLTMTLTGLAADSSAGRVRRHRVYALLAMTGGALAGGLLVRYVAAPAPLWLAAAVLGCCAPIVYMMARRPGAHSWR
jgi:uncharacterized membrane protein YoaK (UPF0700 family)